VGRGEKNEMGRGDWNGRATDEGRLKLTNGAGSFFLVGR